MKLRVGKDRSTFDRELAPNQTLADQESQHCGRCVTVAEYQSFIDFELARGRARQPDHWASPSDGRCLPDSPILGVRARDAEDFCKWLNYANRRRGRAAADAPGFTLPTDVQISATWRRCWGFWCQRGTRIVLAAPQASVLEWQESLRVALHAEFDLDLSRDLELRVYAKIDRNSARDAVLEQIKDRNRSSAPQRDLRAQSVNLVKIWALSLDKASGLASGLRRLLASSCCLHPAVKAQRALAGDIGEAISRVECIDLLKTYVMCVFLLSKAAARAVSSLDPGRANQKLNSTVQMLNTYAEHCFCHYAYMSMIAFRMRGMLPPWEGLRVCPPGRSVPSRTLVSEAT